jgi:hypothetical protein
MLVVSDTIPNYTNWPGLGLVTTGLRNQLTLNEVTITTNSDAVVLHWLPLISEVFNGGRSRYKNMEALRDFREIAYYRKAMERVAHIYNIGYIGIDKNNLSRKEQAAFIDHLRQYGPTLKKAAGNAAFDIYSLAGSDNNAVPFKPSGGWDIITPEASGKQSRRLKENAAVQLFMPEPGQLRVQFSARGCAEKIQYLEVGLENGQKQIIMINKNDYQNYTVDLSSQYPRGLYTLFFRAVDQMGTFVDPSATDCPVAITDMAVYQSK